MHFHGCVFGGSELCMPVDSKAGFATMRSEDFKQGGAGMKQHYVVPVGEDDGAGWKSAV